MKQNWDLREVQEKSLKEMGNLKKFQKISSIDTIAQRSLVEDTILELTGKIQELQIEVNCMNDFTDFQDAESIHCGHSHVTSQLVFFPPHPFPEPFLRNAEPQRRAAKHLGYTWYIGKRFCRSICVITSTLSTKIGSM